jgi:hypothetical protein
MNEPQKIDIDELISLHLDGEASVRQETELKRLMQNDPAIVERVDTLRQQQQMLQALPVETAPASLLDDIRTQLERTLILDNTADESQTFLAAGHLMVRRLLTTAAMILMPLGLLGLVVFQIVKPPAGGPDYTPVDKTLADAASKTTLPADPDANADRLPFQGTLVLRTGNYAAVNSLVKEAIDGQDLLGQAFPDRAPDITCYEITASPKQIAGLIDALTPIRPQCRQVALMLNNGPDGSSIEIPDIQAKQLKMLVYEDSPEMFTRLATRYASANQKINPLDSTPRPDGYPEPTIPTLAGNYETLNGTVEFTIQVERDK